MKLEFQSALVIESLFSWVVIIFSRTWSQTTAKIIVQRAFLYSLSKSLLMDFSTSRLMWPENIIGLAYMPNS